MKQILRPSGGHILDIDSLEITDQFLSLARNVHTRKGFPSRMPGRRIAYLGSNGNALHLLNVALNTFDWWMLFGADDIRAVEGTNIYDISFPGQLAVADSAEWVSTLLNGIPVFTNGKNPPLYWNGLGGDVVQSLPDWPAGTVAGAIVSFRFHLFALDIDSPAGTFENLLMWSDAAEPGALPQEWTPSASNEAGSAFLADTPGRCITGRPLNNQLLVYKPQSFYPIEYVGQPGIYRVRDAVSRTVGVLGPHAICEVNARGQKHLLVGNDDIVLTDGISVTSIAESRIKNFLSNSIDEESAANTFVVNDFNRKEVWVCVPEPGSQFATVAHIWDQARDTWVTRDLNQVRYGTTGYVRDSTPSTVWNSATATWDDAIQLWNASPDAAIQRVLMSEPLNLYLEDTPDVTAVTATLQKLDMTFGDDTLIKLTNRVYIEGSGPLDVIMFRLGARASTSDAIAWGAFVPWEANGAPYEVSGPFISLEISATTTTAWTITRITIEARPNGRH